MGCLSTEQIENIASRQFNGTPFEEEMAHLDVCPQCARRVEECRANHELMRDLSSAFTRLPTFSSSMLVETDALDPWARETKTTDWPAPGRRTAAAEDVPGYRIIREIHRGGQGVVYEAIQESTGRTVAVKVMLEGPFADERARWRFEREVRLVARLKHPNIVAIHDSGIAQGRYYFAMDYIRGQPLDTHVRLARLSGRDIVRLFVSVCDAVAYAHRRGIIHRDLKPSNILVGEDNVPQTLDFGLAKMTALEGDEQAKLRTLPGHVMGTVRYMAPEQTRGELDAIDTRTDVYSLGVILYELLTGRAPYATDKDLMEAFRNIREEDPPRPSKVRREISTDLDAVVLRAMHKEPARRYSSAEELKQDLAAWLDGRPVSARSDSSFYVLRKLATRHYFHTSVIFSLIAAIVGFSAISLHLTLREREARQKLTDTDQTLIARDQIIQDAQAASLANERKSALMAFLVEWNAGRTESAREIRSGLNPNCAEYAAMSFLLDDTVTPEELRKDLGADAALLAAFVTGERHLKHRRLAEAREAFEECALQSGGMWRALAESRLRNLVSVPARSRPG